jgi:hypothetical protein
MLRVVATGRRSTRIGGMPLATPRTTFGDLARDHLEIEVTCAQCGHRRTIDAASPRLRP